MKLDDHFKLAYDENNVILRREENKIRTKKDNTKELYTHQEDRYYPGVKHALVAYLGISLKGSEDVEEVLKRIAAVEDLIINTNFQNRKLETL